MLTACSKVCPEQRGALLRSLCWRLALRQALTIDSSTHPAHRLVAQALAHWVLAAQVWTLQSPLAPALQGAQALAQAGAAQQAQFCVQAGSLWAGCHPPTMQ